MQESIQLLSTKIHSLPHSELEWSEHKQTPVYINYRLGLRTVKISILIVISAREIHTYGSILHETSTLTATMYYLTHQWEDIQ